MSYNFILHDSVIEALNEAVEAEIDNLIRNPASEFGQMKYQLGRIHGIQEALVVAEAARKKHLER